MLLDKRVTMTLIYHVKAQVRWHFNALHSPVFYLILEIIDCFVTIGQKHFNRSFLFALQLKICQIHR